VSAVLLERVPAPTAARDAGLMVVRIESGNLQHSEVRFHARRLSALRVPAACGDADERDRDQRVL
jgi:hypothetical protein